MKGLVKSLMARFAVRKMVGIYVGDEEVTLSRTAQTLLGPVELSSQTEPCQADHLPEVLERLLKPLFGHRRMLGIPVAIGLPSMRVFFSTRPIQTAERDASPTVLLHEVLRSSSVNVDEMAVDLIRSQPGKRPVASLISCRRKYLSALLSALEPWGVRPCRVEPAPFALLRLARLSYRRPRKVKVSVRVFLGASQGVALLITGDQPLAWRSFELPAYGEAVAVRSVVTSLEIMGRHSGEESAPELVMIHGRPDLGEQFTAEEFQKAIGARIRHVPDPSFDQGATALGLAVGCQENESSFDLARDLKRKPSIWELFPWGELAMQTALLVCLTLFLNDRCSSARHAHKLVSTDVAKHAWISKISDDKLDKEKKDLEQKIDTVREYLETRILWSSYVRDTSSGLPESIMLKSLVGECAMNIGAKKTAKPKKSLILKLSATIPDGESMPHELDPYVDALRKDVLLQRDFPVVKLADLHGGKPAARGSSAVAEFTLICLPKVETVTKPAGKGKAQTEKK